MTTKPVRRIGIDLVALLALYAASLYAMAYFRVMEVLLAPGGQTGKLYVVAAMTFLMLRFFVLVLAPGWFLARIFMALSPLPRTIGTQDVKAEQTS